MKILKNFGDLTTTLTRWYSRTHVPIYGATVGDMAGSAANTTKQTAAGSAHNELIVSAPTSNALPVRTIWPSGKKDLHSAVTPKFTAKLLPWFEEFWHSYKRYPAMADIIQQFGFTQDQVNVLNSHKFWLNCLDRRGIARPDRDKSYLTERQIAAVAVLTNFSDPRNPVARIAELGIGELELQGWYSNPAFTNYLKTRAEDVFENVSPVATVELARLIQKGNFPAIKFYYEITGQAQSQETIDVKKALQVIIEAVQKHVKDPELLQAIANEVQAVRGLQAL